MKNKVWIVIIAGMITIGMNGMEKSPSLELPVEQYEPLPKSPSAGANKEAYEEYFENFEYKKNIEEAMKTIKYNKEISKIYQAAKKLSESEYKNFSFMPLSEFEGLVEAALFLLGLSAYRNKLMQDKMEYERQKAPELLVVVNTTMKFIDKQEKEAERVILDAIKKYPNKLV